MRFEALHKYADELERRVRLQTFVLAVKLLENEECVPEGAERPLQDFGYRLALCQGYALSRKEGKKVVMFREDMWCFEPIIGYGWAEPPQYFLDGYNRYPQDVQNLDAGKNYVSDFPCLPVGKFKGVVSTPLLKADFQPDLVIMYCNSAQLSLLLLAREYKDGHDLNCHLSSHAACVYAVVPSMLSGNSQVAIPCRGDRYSALAGDDEIIFTVPTGKLEELLEGLRHLEKYGSRLPRNPYMRREPDLPASYSQILGLL